MVQRRLTKVLKSPITHIESGDVDEAKMGHVSLLDVRGKRKDVGIVVFDRDGNRFYFEWYGYSDAEETWWDDYHCRKRSSEDAVETFREIFGGLSAISVEIKLSQI